MVRVLIIENEQLLGAGVEKLLRRDSGFKVDGITVSDELELVAKVRQFEPDVVVLDEATMLTDPLRLLNLLGDFPKLRVIAVSADDDRVYIYNKRLVVAKRAADLADLIHSELSQT
jgi:DNA-binding NarL/FixJ family response regulator